jgi:PTH1 family peptidyl-tRNA hydrolase
VTTAIIGLGNPGTGYAGTRHNLGFMVLDRLGVAHRLAFDRVLNRALVAEGELAGRDVVLAKPTTYMNLSGMAAGDIIREYDLEPADLLVVCDDLNLPLGRLRLRLKGSDGGHNGLASIVYSLGSSEFPRLRLGIGPVGPEVDLVRFVLEPFKRGEEKAVEEMVEEAAACLEFYLERGGEEAMNRFNRDPLA